MRGRVGVPVVMVVGMLGVAPVGARAQDDRAQAYRMTADEAAAISLDGRVAESVWARAVPLSGFRQADPDAGAPATERTEVRLAHDDETLYVAVTAYQSNPDGIVARILQR
ncbi:MAG: hypothetical protein OEN56_13675, partial [Gemmatimonadota bacterium]|nr:hypothetical protein [Gemmatimonadota bacterium]